MHLLVIEDERALCETIVRRLRTIVSHRARSSSITKRCMRALLFYFSVLVLFSL